MAKERPLEEAFLRNIEKPRQEPKKSFLEKRRYRRFQISDYRFQLFRYDFFNTLGLRRNIAKQIVDISEGGIKLIADKLVDSGAKVIFNLHLPKFAESLEAKGIVKWARSLYEQGSYELGIEFTSISEQDKSKIRHMQRYFVSPEGRLKTQK